MHSTQEPAAFVLHQGLALNKFRNSQLVSEQPADRPKGAVFMTRTKEDLQLARGFVCTSREAILDNLACSHWTPNIFRYGTYADPKRRVIKGHSEDNLKQINTFVVDADFGNHKPAYSAELFQKFVITTGNRLGSEVWPTMVLETPHGYQAYYVLYQPVFVRRKGSLLPAVYTAKRVSEALRQAVKQQLPQVDTGANHFGFFRLPTAQNCRFFEPALTHSFSSLLAWTDLQTQPSVTARKPVTSAVKQPWFDALAHAQVSRGDGQLGRDNTLLTLCLAAYSTGWNEEQVYNFADEWNTRQKSPVSDREVQRIVKSAFSGQYQGASASFIKELLTLYAPEAMLKGKAKHWVKFAKPRNQRKNSHLHEWVGDLVTLIQKHGHQAETVSFTTRQLRQALAISSDSLTRLLSYVEAHALLRVERTRGCRGGMTFITLVMASRQIQKAKTKRSLAWRHYLQLPLLEGKETAVAISEELPESLLDSG